MENKCINTEAVHLPYMGVVFVRPTPIDLTLWKERLGGKMVNGSLILWGLEINPNGQVKLKKTSKKVASAKLDKLVKQTAPFSPIQYIGFGIYDSADRLQVFFPDLRDMLNFINDISLDVLLELGLSEKAAKAQAAVISNELFCSMIRKGKLVNRNMVSLGLRDFNQYSGSIIVDDNLKKSIIKNYASSINEKQITMDGKYGNIKRLFDNINQKKEDIAYGLAAAVIVEAMVRLVTYAMASMHSEHGTRDIPKEIDACLKNETVSASNMGVYMQTGEPYAIMVLNALELMGIVQVIDEQSRVFKKTGKKKIPCVVAATNFPRGEAMIASTIFHQSVNEDINFYLSGEWKLEREKFDIYKKFLDRD